MGTRADFYIAPGSDGESGLQWLGSIAWDGYPEGIADDVLGSRDAASFDAAVKAFFADDRDDVTLPEQGWPWPWGNSRTTDFAYVLIEGEGVVFASFGGQPYWATRKGDDGDYLPARLTLQFPDMSEAKRVAGGSRSGMIVVQS